MAANGPLAGFLGGHVLFTPLRLIVDRPESWLSLDDILEDYFLFRGRRLVSITRNVLLTTILSSFPDAVVRGWFVAGCFRDREDAGNGSGVLGGAVPSSGGPTGGGDCKLNDTIKDACSAGKACKANKDRSEVKCVEASECNEDGCTDDGCCCKMAADATTVCEIPSSGSVIFGSLQVVTLVAAALYFFPVKTSS